MQLEALTPARLDGDRHFLVLAEPALGDANPVDDELAAPVVRVLDRALPLVPHDAARVAHLTTRLGIGGRAIQDDLDGLALPCLAQPPAFSYHCQDVRRRGKLAIAKELRLGELGGELAVDLEGAVRVVRDPERGAGPRALALSFHLGLELLQRLGWHRPALLLEHFLGEVGRKAVGVVEREQEFAVHDLWHPYWTDGAARNLVSRRTHSRRRFHLDVATIVQYVFADLGHAEVKSLGEALFFLPDHVHDAALRLDDLWIGRAHDFHDGP